MQRLVETPEFRYCLVEARGLMLLRKGQIFSAVGTKDTRGLVLLAEPELDV